MIASEVPSVRAVLQRFFELHPDDVARLLEGLDLDETVGLLGEASAAQAASVFVRLTAQTAAQVLERVSIESAHQLLETVDPARSAPLLSRLDEDVRLRLLKGLRRQTAKELQTLMQYPADSAGQLMDPRATTFRPDATVEQATEKLRSLGRKRIHDVILVDDEGRLAGSVALQNLITAPRSERLEELGQMAPARVLAVASREEVVEILSQYKITTLPVVDVEDRLLGVIRHDALVQAAEQEASLDIQSMVGVKNERALSKVGFAVRHRLPWLQINLATAFLAASVVGLFERTIAQFTALAILLPVVAGQSGNTGAQALAVTMRGLALREIRLRHWARMTLKEASVGLLNGLAVAAVTSLGVYVWSGSEGLSLVIGLSMVLSMVLAGISGATIPMVLEAMGQDPAQSSSIILTTVTDVTGFFSFLGLATLLSRLL